MRRRGGLRFRFLALLVLLLSLVPLAVESGAREATKLTRAQAFYRDLSKRRSKAREDYPHLTDEEFANFRPVTTTGMGRGKLYRSSSPVNPWGGRNIIADNASRSAGIATFVNLADTEKKLKAYKGFQESYYGTREIIKLNLSWKFQSEDFRRRLARGITLMARGQPPFLIHCDAGKDRAGFVCAILECLMGASLEEVTADYLLSFYNYFGVEPHTEEYEFIANNEIRSSLAAAFEVRDISKADLAASAERYLLNIGVPAGDVAALRRKLGGP